MIAMKGKIHRTMFFPGILLILYVLLLIILPEKAFVAIKSSAWVFIRLCIPLCLVFTLMLVLNLYGKPADIARFIGKGSGIRGKFISGAQFLQLAAVHLLIPLTLFARRSGNRSRISRSLSVPLPLGTSGR